MHKQLVSIACLTAVLLALAACDHRKGADAAAVGDELKRETREWVAAYNAGDIDAVVEKFAPDAIVMPPESAAVTGAGEIRDLWAEGSASLRDEGLAVKVGDDDVVGAADDVAWYSGSYTYTTGTGTEEPGGNFMQAWENRDGKWRVVRMIWNEDHPAQETAVPPAPTEPPAS